MGSSVITSSQADQLAFARPGLFVTSQASVVGVKQQTQLPAKDCQSGEFVVNLDDSGGDDSLSVPTGAHTTVSDLKQHPNLTQAQSGTLCASYKPDAFWHLRLIAAIAIHLPTGRGE